MVRGETPEDPVEALRSIGEGELQGDPHPWNIGLYWGNIGTMARKMETTTMGLGFRERPSYPPLKEVVEAVLCLYRQS